MSVYLIKNKQNKKFVDFKGGKLGDEDFKGPLMYFSLPHAKEGMYTLKEKDNYQVEKSEIVDFVLHCHEDRIEDLQHHPYVYASWVREQVVQIDYREILVSTYLCCQEEVLDYYANLGFNVGIRNLGHDPELLKYMRKVARMLKRFDVSSKPLRYFK